MTSTLLKPLDYSRTDALNECQSLDAYLKQNAGTELAENADLQPRFLSRPNMMASYFFNSGQFHPDCWGDEVEINWFRCDFVIGDTANGCLGLIELEEAKDVTAFVNRGRRTTYWGDKLEEGIGQVVDWLYSLDAHMTRGLQRARFGFEVKKVQALVIAGRQHQVNANDYERFKWRSENQSVNNIPIRISTYEEFVESQLASLEYQCR